MVTECQKGHLPWVHLCVPGFKWTIQHNYGEHVIDVEEPQVSRADLLKLIETRRKENWRCEDPRFNTFNFGWRFALDEIEDYLLGKVEE